MPRNIYGVGDIIHSDAVFSNPDETAEPVDPRTLRTLLDPASLTCTITYPDDTLHVYTFGVDGELSRQGQGRYRMAIVLPMAGTFKWRFYAVNGQRAVNLYGECDAR